MSSCRDLPTGLPRTSEVVHFKSQLSLNALCQRELMNFPMDINFGLAGKGLWRERAHEAERQEQESAGRKVIGVDKNSNSFQIPPVASPLCNKL